jgi:hypothetical protein
MDSTIHQPAMPDQFSSLYAGLLDWTYDCADRIVLNARFPLGREGGGMRFWWPQLCGSEEELDTHHLMRMGGRFSRRLMSGHPPFGAQIILNGHEYVACQAREKGIVFRKEGNCFVQAASATALGAVADTLGAGQSDQAIARQRRSTQTRSQGCPHHGLGSLLRHPPNRNAGLIRATGCCFMTSTKIVALLNVE